MFVRFFCLVLFACIGQLGLNVYAIGIDDIEDTDNDRHFAVIRCADLSHKIEVLEEQKLFEQARTLYWPLVTAGSMAGMTQKEIFNLMRRAYACAYKSNDLQLAELWSRKLMKFSLQVAGKDSHQYAGYLQLHAAVLRKMGAKKDAMAEEYLAERILLSRQVTVLDPDVVISGSVRNHITSLPDLLSGSILSKSSPSSSSVSFASASQTPSPSGVPEIERQALQDYAVRRQENANSSHWNQYNH